LIVYAHPEPQSLNGALKDLAVNHVTAPEGAGLNESMPSVSAMALACMRADAGATAMAKAS
jgi:putative NADPH-quinone reductase